METSSKMEVDPPGLSAGEGGATGDDLQPNPLKRSNSAPMINALGLDAECQEPLPVQSEAEILATSSCFKPLERVRRFSTSSMALQATQMKGPSRLIQIRHEESVTQKDREVAHEREVQSAMQLSQSMEEIFVDEAMTPVHPQPPTSLPAPGLHPPLPVGALHPDRRPKSLGEPLHIHVSQYSPYASSPSPTRLAKQCFSPSLQQPIHRTGTLTPSPSPSPTRKTFASPLSRRSLSPITLRPSPLGNLGTKRKMDLDGEKMDTFCSPAKRFHAACSPGGSTPERGHMMHHQLLHSISSSSWDASNSPDQRVPNNLSAVSSASTTSSPASFFRPVRESTESRCTDSETSDMAETTDISEQTDMSSQNLSSLSHMSDSGIPDGNPTMPDPGTMLGLTRTSIPSNVQLVSCSSSLSSSSSLSPSLASSHSSVSPSVSSMSPQPSSASCESSSSSLLTQPMSGMTVSQEGSHSPSRAAAAESSQSASSASVTVQYYNQGKVSQV